MPILWAGTLAFGFRWARPTLRLQEPTGTTVIGMHRPSAAISARTVVSSAG